MACISPIFIKQKYERLFVPCGKCSFCLQRKRNDWTIRLRQEAKRSNPCYFITLSYDDDYLPRDNKVHKPELQLLFKRVRKKYPHEKWKYFAVGEYGEESGRPHYHIDTFGLSTEAADYLCSIWQKGFTSIFPSSHATLHYTTKYVVNLPSSPVRGFSLMSNGIGLGYVDDNRLMHQASLKSTIDLDEHELPLPRYYKEKLFDANDKIRIRVRTKKEVEQKDNDLLERLAKVSKSPAAYLSQMIEQKDKVIRKNAKKGTKI